MTKPRKPATRKENLSRGFLSFAEHPLAAIASLLTIVALLGGFGGWVVGTFVFKSDYRRDEGWHDVAHINLRAERLGDEVDRLDTKARYQNLSKAEVGERAL